jgi:hypothetical protein
MFGIFSEIVVLEKRIDMALSKLNLLGLFFEVVLGVLGGVLVLLVEIIAVSGGLVNARAIFVCADT